MTTAAVSALLVLLWNAPSPASAHTSNYCSSCQRDSHGRIKRNESARRAFRQAHPCPATGSTHGRCTGYVIDHIRALKHGGKDEPGNMQWQTREAAKAKDRWE